MNALHIGCGTAYIESTPDLHWTNIDIRSDVKTDHCISIFDFAYIPESYDIVWHSHLLEHFLYPDQAIDFINLCYKLLKPNGVMRLAVPDLYLISKYYIENDFASLSRIYPAVGKFYYKYDTIGERFNYFLKEWEHKFYYDEETLFYLLRGAAFRDIKTMGYDQSRLKDWHNDRMQLESIYIECVK